jgi:NAD+ kinase
MICSTIINTFALNIQLIGYIIKEYTNEKSQMGVICMGLRNKLFFFYKKTDELTEKVKVLMSIAEENGFQLVNNFNEANIIASIGGDGMFLQAVRKTGFRDDALYVGISTGQVGFYCDFNMDDVPGMLEAINNEQIEVRRYPTILVTVDNEATYHCLNECSIRSTIIKTFALDVYIDDLYFERFRGDGMLVATPTGSSAYNKSVNGAVVDPKLPCMQVSEISSINNNQYRTLGSSFILSAERNLRLDVVQDGNDYPIIGMDNEAMSIKHSRSIDIQISDRKIKTVKLKDNSFWHKVKRSFL